MPRKKKTDDTAPKAGKKKPTKAEQTAAHVASDDIERVQVTKEVPQIADPKEAQKQSHELAQVVLEIEKGEADLRDYAGEVRKKLRPLRKERARLAKAVEGNTIMKRLTVYEVRDYKLNQLRYEDADGKPVPGLAPVVMPAEMRQQQLFDGVGEGPRVAAEEEEDGDDDAVVEDDYDPTDDE